jgi:primary-amine oxidase
MQIQTMHALDALTADEIEATMRILRAARPLEPNTRVAGIELHEPPKELVLRQPGSSIDRCAFVVLYAKDAHQTYEVVVSLTHDHVLSWEYVPDVQPPFLAEEYRPLEEAVKADPAVQAALAKRGVTDLSLVQVDTWSAGYYGEVAERGRRLTRGYVWVRQSPTDNGYAHPVEGLVITADVDTHEVIALEDHRVVPIPQKPGNYAIAAVGALRDDLKPLDIVQPDGPSFEVDGSLVRWQKWQFRVGFTAREGLVLHQVGYEDQGRLRSIVYRASISEMVVPYGDPNPLHNRKNAFDAGEYNLGACANSLELGCDCVGVIRYFDAVLVNGAGEPQVVKNAICMHEEDDSILWMHQDQRAVTREVRRSRRLVVSFIATVGNYEYGFYWHFYQDGTIRLEIKLTGIMVTGALEAGEPAQYGQRLTADGLYAPGHQHFFSVRLDMDVDGPINDVYEINSEAAPAGPDNPLGNAFFARATKLTSEYAAQRTTNPLSARHWRIVNPASQNAVGEPVGYALIPGSNVLPFAQPDAWVLRRAGFMTKHLWVTPYASDERFAAGFYPKQSDRDRGLTAWTANDRSLEGGDVVLWYTLGSHHVPRLEDWPVMPVQHIGFTLHPVGFFDRNPALDVPPSKSTGNGQHCH